MSSDEMPTPVTHGTFTCDNCGKTDEKSWTDEEAAREAQENFPGIDISNPAEAGIVCDDCYQHIMGRAQAEAPELIGPGWRGSEAAATADPVAPEPIPDFPGFIASMTARGYALNPCRDHCQDKGAEHVHLRSPDGRDGIIWADGRVSEWDLTQPARLIYPSARRRTPLAVRPSLGSCYTTSSGSPVHVKPGCRC